MTGKENKSQLYKKVALMVIIAELAGAVGSLFTIPSISAWYGTLSKPLFTPPGWVFGPAWIILYALMGIAAGIVWHSKSKDKHEALVIYGAQLFLNVLWSVIFFGFHALLPALIEIFMLWAAIAATLVTFQRISKKAGMLMWPYILWVTFAALLNYSIWAMNA